MQRQRWRREHSLYALICACKIDSEWNRAWPNVTTLAVRTGTHLIIHRESTTTNSIISTIEKQFMCYYTWCCRWVYQQSTRKRWCNRCIWQNSKMCKRNSGVHKLLFFSILFCVFDHLLRREWKREDSTTHSLFLEWFVLRYMTEQSFNSIVLWCGVCMTALQSAC